MIAEEVLKVGLGHPWLLRWRRTEALLRDIRAADTDAIEMPQKPGSPGWMSHALKMGLPAAIGRPAPLRLCFRLSDSLGMKGS